MSEANWRHFFAERSQTTVGKKLRIHRQLQELLACLFCRLSAYPIWILRKWVYPFDVLLHRSNSKEWQYFAYELCLWQEIFVREGKREIILLWNSDVRHVLKFANHLKLSTRWSIISHLSWRGGCPSAWRKCGVGSNCKYLKHKWDWEQLWPAVEWGTMVSKSLEALKTPSWWNLVHPSQILKP